MPTFISSGAPNSDLWSVSTRNSAQYGQIIRLCANTGCQLHLIRPLGFTLEDKQLLRAGLDYHEFAQLRIYDDLAECLSKFEPTRVFALTTKGPQPFHQIAYQAGDSFLFCPESRGLPAEILRKFN